MHSFAKWTVVSCGAALSALAFPPKAAAAGPDLVVAAIDTSALGGDFQALTLAGSIAATIRNQGDEDTPSDVVVAFFEDTNFSGAYEPGTDNLLLELVDAPIAPGEDRVVGGDVTGASVLFRDNRVFVLADADDSIFETDETNNLANTGDDCTFEPPPGLVDPVLEWSWTSSLVDPGSLNVMMTPAVIDLDGNGVPDVVFASTASRGGGVVEVGILRALRGNDGAEIFSVTDPALRVNTAASVAVGDIDLDGRPEIVACDDSGARLIAFEHDGTFKWRSPVLEAINWGAPAIADLDEDGTPEIVIGRQALSNAGALLWTGTGGRGTQAAVGPLSAVADVDLDGAPEVVAGNTLYSASGAAEWTNAAVPDGYVAVANCDADPQAEIVHVSGGNVRLLEHTGAVKWGPVAIPGGGAGGPPTVADYDFDGFPEIGVAGAIRYAVFEHTGALKWAAVTQDGSSNRTGSSVFDFDGDGSAEVVYRDELFLRVYRGTDGLVLFSTPMSSCTWHEYVLVADVDGDANAEIVAVANDNCGFGPQRGVFVFGSASDGWVATRPLWNQHTYHITNIADDGSIPADEADNWSFPPGSPYNNYRQNVLTTAGPLAAPDLTASLLAFACAGDDTFVSARIGNGGAVLVGAGLPVSFYDGDPASGGVLLGTAATSGPLLPGRFETVTLLLGAPVAGAICVVADDTGGLSGTENECDEANNRHCADVADRTPPVLTCPGPIVVDVSDVNDVPIVFVATALDECDPDPSVQCNPPSGSIFPVGDSTVACSATDSSGNSAFCTFDVRVRPCVDFDRTGAGAVADGTLVADQYLPLGVRVSALSDTGTPGAFARRPGPPGSSTDDLVPETAPNYLQTSSGADDSDSGALTFDFVDPDSGAARPVSFVSLAFLDVEDSGSGPGGRGVSRLLAFDGGGVLVGAVDIPVGPNGGRFSAQIGAPGGGLAIARAVALVGDRGDSAGVDALCFEPVAPALDVRILGDAPRAPLGEPYAFHVVSRNRGDAPVTADVVVRATLKLSSDGRLVLGPRPLRAPAGVKVFGGTSDYEIPLPRNKPRLWNRTIHLVAECLDPATGGSMGRAVYSFVVLPPR